MIAEIKAAAKVGDSLGGVCEILGFGVREGLGSHIQWDRKIDGLLSQALMSIQAIKAVLELPMSLPIKRVFLLKSVLMLLLFQLLVLLAKL